MTSQAPDDQPGTSTAVPSGEPASSVAADGVGSGGEAGTGDAASEPVGPAAAGQAELAVSGGDAPDAGVSDRLPDLAGAESASEWQSATARSAALSALLGAALVYTIQLTFRAEWVLGFLSQNAITRAERGVLIGTSILGAILGAGVAVALSIRARRRARPVAAIERALWLASPLLLLTFLPLLLRRKVWGTDDLHLLGLTALFVFAVEQSFRRALPAISDRVGPALTRLEARVPTWLRTRGAVLTLFVAVAGYVVLMSYYAIVRHHRMESATYDLGISDNLMYNALAGEFMRTPLFSGTGPKPVDFLAGHAQFGQYVLLPLYWIRPSSEALVVIQSLLIGLTAIPLYFFARQRLSPWPSFAAAMAFLAHPAIHGANLYEMTYIPVAAVFIITAIWAADTGRWIPFLLATVVALSMREDIPVGMAVVGLVLVLSGRRPTMGTLLIIVSVGYFVFIRFFVMDKRGEWIFPNMMYGELVPAGVEATFKNVILTLLSNPFFVLKKLVVLDKLIFLLHMLVPFAFLPVRRPWLYAALIPGVLLTLLTTNYKPTVELGFHYTMHWIPYLAAAVPLALFVIRERLGVVPMRAAVAALVAGTFVVSYQFGAFAKSERLRVGFGYFRYDYTQAERDRYAQLKRLTKLLPRDASVAASEHVGPHISNRKEAYDADGAGAQGADYFIIGKLDLGRDNNRSHLDSVTADKSYGVFGLEPDFVLLKKGHDTSKNDEFRKQWGL